mmetsp:Transcript_28403/g.32666  ORF Transcript_28403/g.32666 Transcript_28403/m.32666 type:complete len:448 (+) Transcript_28403:126-1469(+)
MNHILGTKPSMEVIDRWLMGQLGCKKTVVGRSIQNRDIVLYHFEYTHRTIFSKTVTKKGQEQDDGGDIRNGTAAYLSHKKITLAESDSSFLFLSLVHGNEPMGLISLLLGAEQLVAESLLSSLPSMTEGSVSHTKMDVAATAISHIYLLPVVNVDAYTLNLNISNGGCRRTNLRKNCNSSSANIITECPSLGIGGVDLNRNYPQDWIKIEDVGIECQHNNMGTEPLSEPESRAVVKVVKDYNITHAMSFHSRANNDTSRPALLIHPYTSIRSFADMPEEDARRFRELSIALNTDKVYTTGTAMEAINYAAFGSTIDWMYAKRNITAFVLEAVPPCNSRWCNLGVYQNAEIYAKTLKQFVDLTLDNNANGNDYIVSATHHSLPKLLILFCIVLSWFLFRYRRHLLHCCNQYQAIHLFKSFIFDKEKNDGPKKGILFKEHQMELLPLES